MKRKEFIQFDVKLTDHKLYPSPSSGNAQIKVHIKKLEKFHVLHVNGGEFIKRIRCATRLLPLSGIVEQAFHSASPQIGKCY